MKRFRFRLQTVLKLRQRAEDQRKKELAEVLALRRQQADRQAALQAQLAEHKQKLRVLAAAGPLDMDRLIDVRQYATALEFDIRRTREMIRLIDQEADRRRAALAEATRQRRVIEKLQERQRAAYEAAAARLAQAEMDEIGLVGYTRAAVRAREA